MYTEQEQQLIDKMREDKDNSTQDLLEEVATVEALNAELVEALKTINIIARTETFFGHISENQNTIIATCESALAKARGES